jgi:hypothetical protein
MRLRLLVLTTAVFSLAAVTPAVASTTVGDVESAPTVAGPAGQRYIPIADPAGHSYVVPLGGVVTSVSAWLNAGAGAPGTARVFLARGAGPSFTVVGGATLSITGTGTVQKASAPARIPVQAGDRLAIASPGTDGATIGATNVSGTVRFGGGAVPADGDVLDTSSGFSDQGNAAMSMAALVEPDADHDGYGDETQDGCPSDPAVHDACGLDLQTTASATPTSLTQGDVATIVASVANAGPGAAIGAAVTLGVPSGLQVLAASTTGGECAGATCALGDLPKGASRKVFLVVRAAAAGSQAVTIAASAAGTETVPA